MKNKESRSQQAAGYSLSLKLGNNCRSKLRGITTPSLSNKKENEKTKERTKMKNKTKIKRGIEKRFVLIGIIALAVSLMVIAGIAIANSLNDEASLLEQELINVGYGWLVKDIENSGNYDTNSPEFSNGQFSKISNINNRIVHIVREGRCQRLKVDGTFVFKQKAVDVLLAMDLTNVPIKYPYVKKIILISSDSDFVPVLENLMENGVKIILYTYYEKIRDAPFSRSNHLIKSVDKYALLSESDFLNSLFDTEGKDEK